VAEVTILMACRDGAAVLPEQLGSIAGQVGADWALLAGDDGSRDATRAVLDRFAADWPGRVTVVAGPQAGVAAHFLSLLDRAVQGGAGALAFADQDDLWRPDKLAEALAALRAYGDRPALFVAAYALWRGGSDNGAAVRPVARGFAGALVQAIGPGHAMVMNAAGARVLAGAVRAGARPKWHDWWACQMVLGCGGAIVTGTEVQVLYRQHTGNLLGEARGWRGALRRAGRLFGGTVQAEMDQQWAALQAGRGGLTEESASLLDRATALRQKGRLRRALGYARLGLTRRGRLGWLVTGLAVIVGGL
jgi:hypothetical protein